MVKAWLVRLKLARDDGGSVGDEGVRQLTRLLTESAVFPLLRDGGSGTVLVQMRIDASTDRAAKAAAEDILRDRAHGVWEALGLPPFTITFVEVRPEAETRS
jgi:hypothetical protein